MVLQKQADPLCHRRVHEIVGGADVVQHWQGAAIDDHRHLHHAPRAWLNPYQSMERNGQVIL
jgi:hypothetical protein